MNRILLFTIVLMSFARTNFAQKFTAGNLVVYRVGTGNTALSGVATTVYLDEYTPTGTFVRSVKLPEVAAELTGSNKRVTASGSATSEGFLTRSANGLYLLAEGYDADTATAGIGKTTAFTVNRVAASIDVNSTINSSNSSPSFSSGNNIRAIASVDGNSFYLAGGATGLAYMPVQAGGVDSATQLSTTIKNIRCVEIFGGQLYVSTASGSAVRVGSVGTGLPTTAGQTIANLPGVTLTKSSPYQFFIATLPAGQVLYIADDSAGIRKYSLVSGNWVANDSLKITAANSGYGIRGITGVVQGTNVGLYITYAGTTSGIYGVVDNTGFNTSITTAVAVPIATAATNTAFRGIAWAPLVSPLPVHLVNFNAAIQNNQVLVSWMMADETNEKNYTIEKSTDGKNFTVINNVVPFNNGANKYTVTDAAFNSNTTTYYRLKVTADDGTISYSSIAVVSAAVKHTTLSVYPNPANSFIVVNHAVAKNATIKIHTVNGSLLLAQKANDGDVQTYIPVNNIANGNYVVTYTDETTVNSILFNKQ